MIQRILEIKISNSQDQRYQGFLTLRLSMEECVFCKIRDREIPKEFTYEDKDVMVFPDIYPVKPIHLLVMPKKHIPDFLDLSDDKVLAKVKAIIQKMIRMQKLNSKGYRLVVHGGGAAIINHLHIHVMGPVGKKAKL